MDLQTPVKNAEKAYKMYASRLLRLGIQTLADFLYHIPSRYEDYSLISKIGQVQAGETVTIQGTVDDIKNEFTRSFKKIQRAIVSDQTGTIEAIWFNQPFLTNIIHKGDKISLAGKIDWFRRILVMQSPQYEVISNLETIHTGRLVPVYPEIRGVSSKWLRRQIYKIIKDCKQNLTEYLPYSIKAENRLMDIAEAIEQIHFPKNLDLAQKARERLSFDELLLLHLSAMQKRAIWEKTKVGQLYSIAKFKKHIEEFWKKLPFELTNAQKKAVRQIFSDLASKKPMNRLLEGDVGSGKTVVSAIAMYLSFLNGFQSVLMSPTEILAQQHYRTISNLLSPFGVRVGLTTGSKKLKIENGKLKIDVLVGTHAVLSKSISFNKLGLVVIDEQQRFGVEQRALIRQKGKSSHLLTMTATPIPRTIALTLYGDLDLSVLNEMPHGRKKIKTWLVPPEKRNNAYKWIKSQLSAASPRGEAGNSQLFVVCPFIEPSESMQTVKAAKKEYEYLKKEVFGNLKLGLLHGRLKSKEKDEVLGHFKEGKIDILVSTPVVEVGIDIPNATLMIIEGAERFGLAQLHQLRGRVGRGDKQSYCLLFTDSKNSSSQERLKAMETLSVGEELAELDLKLRGPGQIYGIMQHGRPMFKIASFSDFAAITKTKKEAEKIFPKIKNYPLLLKKLENISLKKISPD